MGVLVPPSLSLATSRLGGGTVSLGKMLVAAAADRNKEPILGVLRQYISPTAPLVRVLEVASGTGQHVAHFARALPNVHWLPSELDQRCLRSISEYIQKWSLVNVEQPRTLDASQSWKTWGLEPNSLQMVVCINMIHISEPRCTQGLFNGAGQVLQPGGVLLTYGELSISSSQQQLLKNYHISILRFFFLSKKIECFNHPLILLSTAVFCKWCPDPAE